MQPFNVQAKPYSDSFAVPKGLEGRVEFWKLVFTKYGKNHRVFHNRSHPEIIYSVLDFTEYEDKLSGRTLLNAKKREIKKETEKIKSALSHLASGGTPRNNFEKRVDKLYSSLKGNKRSNLREAADDKMIRYQTGIKEKFHDGLVRSGRYLRTIEHIFVEEGLPPELGRLPLVESSFDYNAYSSVGAAGIWQFMPATAKRYMKVNRHFDERRDPIIATRSAAKYLKNSYQKTGEWSLAVTSYNHGLSGIMRGVKQVGSINIVEIIDKYSSRTFGFASSNFYAEFLAALIVERNIDKYFPGLKREKAVEFDEVLIKKAIRFSDLRVASGADSSTLKDLNRGFKPSILNDQVFIPSGTFVKMPLGVSDQFVSKISGSQLASRSTEFRGHLYTADNTMLAKRYPAKTDEVASLIGNLVQDSAVSETVVAKKEKDASSTAEEAKTTLVKLASASSVSSQTSKSTHAMDRKYKVKRGDTLIKIAAKYNADVKSIMRANGFSSARQLRAGAEINIPGLDSGVSGKRNSSHSKVVNKSYKVKRGDTLSGISKRFNSSVDSIMSENNLSSTRSLRAGQKITIPTNIDTSSKIITYTVKPGDVLGVLAMRFDSSVSDIMRHNGLRSENSLRAGEEIKIPSSSTKSSSRKSLPRLYIVRRGDTLIDLAKKYDLSVNQIMQENNLRSSRDLKAGAEIRLP